MESAKPSKKNEDEFFARQEFDRIRKLKEQKLADMAEDEKKKLKDLHFMRCPKCGNEMLVIDYESIELDKCSACGGIYFDNGELEQLLGKKSGFTEKLFSIFKD